MTGFVFVNHVVQRQKKCEACGGRRGSKFRVSKAGFSVHHVPAFALAANQPSISTLFVISDPPHLVW